ncbi:MAG: DNA translocase FtsK [Epsilonproteobacteria bacterium]|nr:MAG: DNA translocase FtsK [Campylobacterota bacterium]
MRDTLFITSFGILFYLGLATIVGDAGSIGQFGAVFAEFNRTMFGYISFVYLFVLVIPMFLGYRYHSFNLEKSVAVTLLFFAGLIFQALVTTGPLRGFLGSSFVDFLTPFIGSFGVWIFWVMATSVSVVMVMDRSIQETLGALKTPSLRLPSLGTAEKHGKSESAPKRRRQKKTISKEKEPPEIEEDVTDAELVEDDGKLHSVSEEAESTTESSFKIKRVKVSERSTPVEEESAVEEEAPSSTIVSLAKKTKEKRHAVIVDELEENKKLQEEIETGKIVKPKNFKLPSIDFLQKAPKKGNNIDEKELDDKIGDLIDKLAHFKIDGDVIRTYAGPVVSTFEFKPGAHIKVSRILNLQDDLAMALKAASIRIQAPIPGKDVVGIEIPNKTVETIYLRDIFESKLFQDASSPLTIVLGKDIVGKPFITDLKKLPHLLIAGTTGSGKSVGINAMILSLLYKNSPDNLRLLMIDPKMLEFSIYNDIPHLLTPVITKAKQAIVALANMVHEMERRYVLMSESRTKNIENYNEKAKKEGSEIFPYIVVIIDELADLMMTSGKDVEHSIARLAQMARASGIHLVVATQRPSVDVVTGLIKANLPSRISYRVGQKIDSKIILDTQGAESLLGRGDMLFTPPGMTGLVRLHAPWSTEEEIEEIVEFLKMQREPQYDKSFLAEVNESGSSAAGEGAMDEMDELYEDAKNVILTDRKTSISYLQRKLQIGYNRSARIIEQMEQRGVLSAANAKGNREIVGG